MSLLDHGISTCTVFCAKLSFDGKEILQAKKSDMRKYALKSDMIRG